MTNTEDIEKLQQEEIEKLSQEEELFELEDLITAGKDAKIPISFIYPNTNKRVGAIIKPLTSNEWNNCMRKVAKFHTSFQLEIVKKGLLNTKEEPIPSDLIEIMPQGAIAELYQKIAEISGIHENTEDMIEASKKIMGF